MTKKIILNLMIVMILLQGVNILYNKTYAKDEVKSSISGGGAAGGAIKDAVEGTKEEMDTNTVDGIVRRSKWIFKSW